MTTKQQERDALEKIRIIVASLGEDSYIGTAFEGCFDFAEQNIEYDAAFSMKYYQTDCARLIEDNKRLVDSLAQERKQNNALRSELDRELEWKPFESTLNVIQSDYERLAGCVPNGAHYMTDDEAKDWICGEFDFIRDSITILHEIDEEEINRHRQCRKTGRKIDRRPVYCATDYHYIRFNTFRWYYEVWNDCLRPFYE